VNATDVDFRSVSPIFGVEVIGLDLRAEVAPQIEDRLREAYNKHGLLLFRGQDLSEQNLIRAASIFGEVTYLGDYGDRKFVSNVDPLGLSPKGELAFHTDYSFYDPPLRGLLLYGVEVPPEGAGGDTMFASVQLAYEHLPSAMRERIRDLQIVHVTNELKVGKAQSSVSATHPMTFPHPLTGEKVVFCDPRHFDHIVGLSPDEGLDLVRELSDGRLLETHGVLAEIRGGLRAVPLEVAKAYAGHQATVSPSPAGQDATITGAHR
jgi:taurine dioxygenase